jgi:phospholipid/cholesterol/gamma-HCH transport system permease protein
MVLALQLFYTLRKFGSEALLGPAIALSLIRELGPVLSALMVTGRAGSALTAEIGIMRITEQIDALTSMALNPMRYLIVPNMVASIIVFPLLAAIFDVIGIYGGYIVAVDLLGVSSGTYFSQMENFVDWEDIRMGLYKSLSFGVLVSWICCYKGFYTGYGAEGVSKSTTEAVVTSSVLILIWDYFVGSVLI